MRKMHNPRERPGEVPCKSQKERMEMFHAPQAFHRQNHMGLGEKESSIVEFTSLGNCPWLAEYMHTKSSRPSRAKQSTELDCSCAHLSGAKNQKTRVCLHQRKIAGQRCPRVIMLETASNIIQRVLKHPGRNNIFNLYQLKCVSRLIAAAIKGKRESPKSPCTDTARCRVSAIQAVIIRPL